MTKKNNYKELIDNIKGIVLFDGYCNLCSWSVQFIIKRDKNDYFRFASLQSVVGRQLLNHFEIKGDFNKSVVFIEEEFIYFKSDAILQITKKLRHLWPVLSIFIIIPKSLRDAIYNFIAKNRFKWFGRKIRCYMPEKNLDYKFL